MRKARREVENVNGQQQTMSLSVFKVKGKKLITLNTLGIIKVEIAFFSYQNNEAVLFLIGISYFYHV